MILTGSLILFGICLALIGWAAMQPEIKHMPDDDATDMRRIAVILAACVQPTNRIRAGVAS